MSLTKLTMLTKPTMKNKTIVYLAKGEKEKSALLKRRAVEDYFGKAELSVTKKGKPIIVEPQGYGISVSHSGDVIAVVIAPAEVGIDIQERFERDNSRMLSFFHESERENDFYDLWTKKESYGKMTGDGIFSQKGKRLETDAVFIDISKEISEYAEKEFSAKICLDKKTMQDVEYTIKVDFA